MNWSIQAELQAAAEASTLEEALRKLGLLSPEDRFERLQIIADWRRGGAESYVFCFDLYYAAAKPCRLMYKAFTPTYFGDSLEVQFSSILQRRQLLANKGVRIPRLYMTYRAAVLEDYIPYQLLDVIGTARGHTRQAIFGDLLCYADALDELGFSSVAPFDGLLSDGHGAFVVDFGADLGPAEIREDRSPKYRAQLLKWFARNNISGAPLWI